VKAVDDETGRSSHLTNIPDKQEKREYIALGKMIKESLLRRHAPRCWSLENQAFFNKLFVWNTRRFI